MDSSTQRNQKYTAEPTLLCNNRNLVAQISHMMATEGVIIKQTTDVRMAELLEPEKGKNHSVRGALAVSPDDKQVKKAVFEVLERYGVKVS